MLPALTHLRILGVSRRGSRDLIGSYPDSSGIASGHKTNGNCGGSKAYTAISGIELMSGPMSQAVGPQRRAEEHQQKRTGAGIMSDIIQQAKDFKVEEGNWLSVLSLLMIKDGLCDHVMELRAKLGAAEKVVEAAEKVDIQMCYNRALDVIHDLKQAIKQYREVTSD